MYYKLPDDFNISSMKYEPGQWYLEIDNETIANISAEIRDYRDIGDLILFRMYSLSRRSSKPRCSIKRIEDENHSPDMTVWDFFLFPDSLEFHVGSQEWHNHKNILERNEIAIKPVWLDPCHKEAYGFEDQERSTIEEYISIERLNNHGKLYRHHGRLVRNIQGEWYLEVR